MASRFFGKPGIDEFQPHISHVSEKRHNSRGILWLGTAGFGAHRGGIC